MYNVLSLFGQDKKLILLNKKEIMPLDLISLGSLKSIREFLSNHQGVYCFYDYGNSKIYIGSSKNLWKRFLNYKNAFFFKKTTRINKKLLNRFNKHGFDKIKFFVIKLCLGNETQLRESEQYFLDNFKPFDNNGYNISKNTKEYPSTSINETIRKKIIEANSGENSSNAILTDKKVQEIKEKLCSGAKLKQLSSEYGVSTTVISNIKRNLTWTHVKLDKEKEDLLKARAIKDKRKNFSKELILSIKNDIKEGVMMTEIAKKYGIGYTAVSGLKYGNYYKHINP